MNHRDWLLGLYGENGPLTPEIVREAARPKDSPAHAFVFDRPATEAAESWYLERAHTLLRSVKVTYRAQPDAPPRSVRVFHAVTGDDESIVYESLESLIQRPDKLAEARQAAIRRVRDAESAVEEFDVIAGDRKVSSEALAAIRSARELLDAA